jgi:membrane fusion protein (multidrug efflux system)
VSSVAEWIARRVLDEEFESAARAVHCEVVLSGAVSEWIGVARHASADGVLVHLAANDAGGLDCGDTVDLRCDREPVGPIRAPARATSVAAGRDERGRPVVAVSLEFLDTNETQKHELRIRLLATPIPILATGFERPLEDVDPRVKIVNAPDPDAVLRRFAEEDAAVVVLGPLLPPADARAFLARFLDEYPESPAIHIVLAAGETPEAFQEFVNRDRIFYLSRTNLANDQLRALLRGAIRRFQVGLEKTGVVRHADDLSSDGPLDFCIRLSAQQDLANAAGLLVETVRTFLGADRAQCLLYNPDREVLTPPGAERDDQRMETAAAGLVGYVARTGQSIRLERAGNDPRYDAEADDPEGNWAAHYLAAPVWGTGSTIVAVVSAMRDRGSPFSSADARIMDLLVSSAAPTFTAMLWQMRVESLLRSRARAEGSVDLFRQEALEYHNASWDERGEVLQAPPPWLRRTHWISIALLLAGLAYVTMARVNEAVSGQAVIRARSKIAVTANTAGLVRSVEVSSGDRVLVGDLLIRLFETAEASAIERFRDQVRAPAGGAIQDIRVRPGQQVTQGDQVASIVDEQAGYELIALLPGSYAPQIQPGMLCVVKLTGYPDSRQSVDIDWVGSEILSARDAARYAGLEGAASGGANPVVIVRSTPLPVRFRSGGRAYPFRDGMVGEAEVTVRSEPMLVNLIPGLKDLWRK